MKLCIFILHFYFHLNRNKTPTFILIISFFNYQTFPRTFLSPVGCQRVRNPLMWPWRRNYSRLRSGHPIPGADGFSYPDLYRYFVKKSYG